MHYVCKDEFLSIIFVNLLGKARKICSVSKSHTRNTKDKSSQPFLLPAAYHKKKMSDVSTQVILHWSSACVQTATNLEQMFSKPLGYLCNYWCQRETNLHFGNSWEFAQGSTKCIVGLDLAAGWSNLERTSGWADERLHLLTFVGWFRLSECMTSVWEDP